MAMMNRSTLLGLILATTIGTTSTRAADQAKPAGALAIGDPFPRLEAEFLTGRKAVLPDAAAGKSALVMMGFTYDSRFAVEKWAEYLRPEMEANDKVTFFEEGQAAMDRELQTVATQFGGSRGFGGVAIHRYNASWLSGQPNWPLPGQ